MLRPSIMEWDGQQVTDHNRQPVQVSFEPIERKSRMAGGTLRKYVVVTKRTWTTSWEMLPDKNGVIGFIQTVDGGMAGQDIESFYEDTKGKFSMKLYFGDGTFTTHNVMFSDFSKEITKRSGVDFWSISVSLEEV